MKSVGLSYFIAKDFMQLSQITFFIEFWKVVKIGETLAPKVLMALFFFFPVMLPSVNCR
jgi:hypothetical protein